MFLDWRIVQTAMRLSHSSPSAETQQPRLDVVSQGDHVWSCSISSSRFTRHSGLIIWQKLYLNASTKYIWRERIARARLKAKVGDAWMKVREIDLGARHASRLVVRVGGELPTQMEL